MARKIFRKKHPLYTRPRLNPDLPFISSLVYCKSDALYHEVTRAGYVNYIKTCLRKETTMPTGDELGFASEGKGV
uniref:Uncharacterized protein n=1 Tax=Timema tahoe TaxID=61484 RepID=A0A7R9IAP6_9NEOP|nr:unnamed protein product [Timema tahoe]